MTSFVESTPTPAPSSKPKKNWDILATQELEKEKDKPQSEDPNVGGDNAVNGLFQQIYASADDDAKRAMLKSYTESGGTSLSTDWKEVSEYALTNVLASLFICSCNFPGVEREGEYPDGLYLFLGFLVKVFFSRSRQDRLVVASNEVGRSSVSIMLINSHSLHSLYLCTYHTPSYGSSRSVLMAPM